MISGFKYLKFELTHVTEEQLLSSRYLNTGSNMETKIVSREMRS